MFCGKDPELAGNAHGKTREAVVAVGKRRERKFSEGDGSFKGGCPIRDLEYGCADLG